MQRIKLISIILIIAAATLFVSLYFSRTFRTQIAVSGAAKVEEIIHKQVNDTCRFIIDQSTAKYIDETKTDAQTKRIDVNSSAINMLAAKCNTQCEADLAEYRKLTLQIPKGAFTGSTFFADKGRMVTYTLHVSYDVATEYLTTLQSVGINQIRYAVYLIVNTTAHITIPAGVEDKTYTYYLPVCESMYAADVPNVYVSGEDRTNYLDLLP